MVNKQEGVLGRGLSDVAPPPVQRKGVGPEGQRTGGGVAPASPLFGFSSLLQFQNRTAKPVSSFSSLHPETICIASGKGGTGKTFLATNLAVALVQQGKKVLLFDADLGLGNIHLHLGLNPSLHIGHFLRGEKNLNEIVQEGLPALSKVEGPNILFLPGGSGVSELTNLTLEQWSRLVLALKGLSAGVDMVLIDLPAGIAGQIFRFFKIASKVIVVTTPEISSRMDAYALVKSIKKEQIPIELNIVVNRVQGKLDAGQLFQKMSQMMAFHLKGTTAQWLGFIPEDRNVGIAIGEQLPIFLLCPDSPATGQVTKIANRLIGQKTKEETCSPSPSPIKREGPEKQPQPST